MKASEIRELSVEDMEAKIAELYKELRDLRFQDAVGQFTATSRPREIRKAIARIHTIRTEKESVEA
jgi:large subunit ribosomal protein L29